MPYMVINEIFYSIQGEGLLTGIPSVFIRFAGCPLRCRWCDTKYAQNPASGIDLTIPQIIDKVENLKPSPTKKKNIINSAVSANFAVKTRHVVLTGGEPMVNPQLPALAKTLKKLGKHITIETAGIKFISGLACDLMSISPKTLNSALKTKKGSEVVFIKKGSGAVSAVRRLIEYYPYQLKFVVETPDDLPKIQKIIASLGNVDPPRVLLMPQARTRDELIAKSSMVAELCKQAGFTFCTRLQIILFDGQRGK
jgi:7-carboxy-7-deazaguanine synthase